MQVGDFLKDRYEAATEVKLNKRGKLQVANKRFARPTKLDLVYVEDSPDYCSAEHVYPFASKSSGVSAVRKSRKAIRIRQRKNKRASATRSHWKRSSGSLMPPGHESNSLTESGPHLIENDLKSGTTDLSKHKPEMTAVAVDNHHQQNNHRAPLPSVFGNGSPVEGSEFTYEVSKRPQSNFADSDTETETDHEADAHEDDMTASDRKPVIIGANTMDNEEELESGNQPLAWLGTQGRVCNRSSLSTDSCSLMCCGRGYNTQRVLVREKCNCKFNWCCWVQCDTCTYMKTIYTCK